MRRSRTLNKPNELKKVGVSFVVLILVFSAVKLVGLGYQKKDVDDDDFKLGIISDQQLQLVSISENRKMVNVLRIKENVPVWLPSGDGWRPANQIRKIVLDSNKNNLANDIFWYNYGFLTNETVVKSEGDDWKNNWWLISKMGLLRWIKYKANSSQMLYKEEELVKDTKDNTELLDEIMQRDFADNKLISEDLRLSVFNATSETGLANFISDRLEWAGYSVVSAENTNQKIDRCVLVYGPKTETKLGWMKLVDNFDNCKIEYGENLNEDEVELYFGEGFVSMVKYSSYK